MGVVTMLRGLLLAGAVALLGVAAWRLVREPPASQEARDLVAFIDQDGDGRIGPDEYTRVTEGELPMRVVDADGSGWLEPWEVDAVITYVSPLRASMSWVPRAR